MVGRPVGASRVIRAFVELIPGPGGEVRLTSAEMAHVKGARRARGRVEIELLDGRGGVACAELDASTGNATVVARCRRDAPPSVLLAVAIARGSRFDFLVEKCTELAVTELAPIRFERSQAGRGEGRDERWERVARSAAKQSGSPYLPEIHPVRTLDGFLELWGERALSAPGLLLALDPDGQTRPISDVVRGRGAGAPSATGKTR